MEVKFSSEGFAAAQDRESLAKELQGAIEVRLRESTDPEAEAKVIVSELRGLGHDLWSYDESAHFQTWCADWASPAQLLELLLEMSYPHGEPASAIVSLRELPRGQG